MKSNNNTGIIIIAGILVFAAMKAFDIRFNLENIKVLGSVGVSVVIALLIFFGMQSKKSSNPEHYIEPEPENDSHYVTHQNGDHITPQPQQNYHNHNPHEEENNRYGSYHAPTHTPAPHVPPPVPPEEDNRWS